MKTFTGTKTVRAKPMSRKEYNDLRGWEVPADEDPNDAGMLVEYLDGGKANHPDFSGYISWSPLDVFQRAYKEQPEKKEKESVAPKVSPEEVEGMFEQVVYVILPDGRTTIALGTMKNGFTVRGESSCVCKENFDEKLGEEYAYKDMINKSWPLAGLLLAERLYQEKKSVGETWVDRLHQEWVEVRDRLVKLKAFLNNPPAFLEPVDLRILSEQSKFMGSYEEILRIRLERARQG